MVCPIVPFRNELERNSFVSAAGPTMMKTEVVDKVEGDGVK